jgi:hypothetical protein
MRDVNSSAELSHVVKPHPARVERPDGGWLDGTVAIGGAFNVDRDLQPGDELVVTIAGADGEVLAGGIVEVGPVGFKPVKVRGFVVGETRVHKAKAA